MITGLVAVIAEWMMPALRKTWLAKLAAWALLIALVAGVLFIGKCTYDANVIEKHGAKVEAADAKGDAAATVKAAETKGTIDAGNDRAKAASDRSDDPLAAAFDSLRSETSGSGKAPR